MPAANMVLLTMAGAVINSSVELLSNCSGLLKCSTSNPTLTASPKPLYAIFGGKPL